jgi:hypothetical protein
MNDLSWRYQETLQWFYRKDYCKKIESFINFSLLNPKNISGDEIRWSYVKCKNKKFHQSNVMMIYFLKNTS